MVEGGMKCVKYVLFAFNFIFFLAGLALIITGAVVQTKFSDYLDFFGESVPAAAIVLIVVGCIIFIVGFFGCCGAYKENYCMTMTFAALLIVICIIELSAGIAAYVMKDKVEDLVKEQMEDGMKNYGKPDNEGVTETWDRMQEKFECCGTDNSSDWAREGISPIPTSCCAPEQDTCAEGDAYPQGCYKGFIKWIKDNIIIVGGIGIGLAFVQVFGIILACCLARSIKKEYEVV